MPDAFPTSESKYPAGQNASAPSVFRFKQFCVSNEFSALKVGTDAVLLGALTSLPEGCPRVLDIGTGTGVIALMLAQRLAGNAFRITGIDIDGPSAREAAANFAASPWKGNLEALECPLERYRCEDGAKFDLIVSNPPFFDDSLQNPDPRECAARHSVSLTLAQICAFAEENLDEGGRHALIVPAEAAASLRRTAASFSLAAVRFVSIRTTEKKPVRRTVAEFVLSRRSVDFREETLLLCDPRSPDGRTAEYRALVEPFLLR